MNQTEKFETMYIKSTWALILGALIYVVLANIHNTAGSMPSDKAYYNIAFLALLFVLNYLKFFYIKKGFLDAYWPYILIRVKELIFLIIAVQSTAIYYGEYIFVVFTVIVTTFSRGKRMGYTVVGYWLGISILVKSIWSIFAEHGQSGYLLSVLDPVKAVKLVFSCAMYIILVRLCGMIYEYNYQAEKENKKLVQELAEKYDQIAVAQEEIKYHYEKMKDTNVKLEETNKKLTSNVAEFFTLQQITQAIGSIFDIKELLKYVNDIILGVMGANNSTVILFDEDKNRLKVHTTNIRDPKELAVLSDNVNCRELMEVLNSGNPIMENFVDPEEYVLTQGREVDSLICIPLITKARKFGLVLIEHKYNNAFDEENVRLLGIIGQQVGIAMENAELYQKMHDLATKDGLTGVYNRLYFQERLEEEFNSAQKEGYNLSLAIFDIDHFKRFNDTFGHLFGDKVLQKIAETIQDSLRSTDIFARFGGEEFIILLPRTNLNEAFEKVEALRKKIAKTNITDNLITASVTVSFGISSYPECADNKNTLLKTSDDALYSAKESGRNCAKAAKTLF